MKTVRTVRVLDVILGVTVLVLIVAIVFIALVVAYPRAGRLVATRFFFDHPEAMILTSDLNDSMSTLAERARQGFDYRVSQPIAMLGTGDDAPKASTDASSAPVSETSCAPCHKDYAEKLRFGDIYFDHRVHAGGKLACGSCHEASGPSRDTSPPMERCAPCHEQESETDCDVCHAPGTIFHGARLSGDRKTAEKCSVCHPPSLLVSTTKHSIDADAEESCRRCHEPAFCARCHPASHGKGYAAAHPREMRRHVVGPAQCWSCHDAAWCAMACHGNRRAISREVNRS